MDKTRGESHLLGGLLPRRSVRSGAGIAAVLLATTACDPSASEVDPAPVPSVTEPAHDVEHVAVYVQPGSSYFKTVALITRETPVEIDCEVPSTKTGAVDSLRIEFEKDDRQFSGYAFETLLTGGSKDIADCDPATLPDTSLNDVETTEIENVYTGLGELKQQIVALDGHPNTQMRLLMDSICEGLEITRHNPPGEESIPALDARDEWWNAHFDVLRLQATNVQATTYAEQVDQECPNTTPTDYAG